MAQPVQSAFTYVKNNLFGNWNAGTANVLPAVLTTWSNLLSLQGNPSYYQLYREQANSYVDTARDNADLIKKQGEIALRNLSYKNNLERGNDVVRIAASNGNLSGSNLDVLVRKERIRKMNEMTVKANYTNQAMLELVNGYRKAGDVYGTLYQKAVGDKYSALAAILKGVETYVGLSVRDAKIESNVDQGYEGVKNFKELSTQDQEYRYNRSTKKTESNDIILSGDGNDYTNQGVLNSNTMFNDEIRFLV